MQLRLQFVFLIGVQVFCFRQLTNHIIRKIVVPLAENLVGTYVGNWLFDILFPISSHHSAEVKVN